MDLQAVGARIRTAREAKGMTQEDLAAALELSRNHISVIERGIKAPRLETFVALANILDGHCPRPGHHRAGSVLDLQPQREWRGHLHSGSARRGGLAGYGGHLQLGQAADHCAGHALPLSGRASGTDSPGGF